jgi:hypothetical protein
MGDFYKSDLAVVLIVIAVAMIIISVLIVIAVLKIPQIAKYQKATLILTALMAKKQGLDKDFIQTVLNQADDNITYENGRKVEKEIFS